MLGEDTGQVRARAVLGLFIFINLSINQPYEPASLVLGIYLRQVKTCDLKKSCFKNKFIAALFTNRQQLETSQMSTDGRMDKRQWHVHGTESIQHEEETNYRYVRQHRQIWKTLSCPKEALHGMTQFL